MSAKQFSDHDIKFATLMKVKLLKYAITGAEIIFGSKPHFEPEYSDVICIGKQMLLYTLVY